MNEYGGIQFKGDLKMNKREYLIITFHSLDDAMDLDAKQTSSMKDV